MKKLKFIPVLLVVLCIHGCTLFSAAGLTSQGQPTKKVEGDLSSSITSSPVRVDHSDWDVLLKKYVDDKGMVDYRGFETDRISLNSYLYMLSSQNPSESWSVQELLAYYINLYNAYTVALILDNYPVNSIKDINAPWTRGIVPIGDTNHSLGGIENSILRKMNEPRIHFAINCASISCPKLLNEAYVASRIDEQLDRVTREFINSSNNDISPSAVKLSSIFDWYENDFIIDGKKDVIGYLNLYLPIKIKASTKLEFKNYDWNLNEQK